jgi:hypothetical protein
MRLVDSSFRMLFALGVCVTAGCSLNASGQDTPSSDTLPGGQACSTSDGTTVSGGSGDVQLRVICTNWTCTAGPSSSGSGGIPIGIESSTVVTCTAQQPPGGPIPPGTYGCGPDDPVVYCPPPSGGGGGGGASCVATETELTCTLVPPGGSSGGGSGGETGGACPPGTEGCPGDGSGGGSGHGSGGGSGKGSGGGSGEGSGGSSGEGGSGGGSGGSCTFTQGYWKNHPDAWPVTSLTIGGVTYSEADLLAIFAMDPGSDASLILAHQLIAAMLNQAAAANPPAAVTQALGSAQAWMAANKDADGRLPYGTPPGSAAANQATALSSTLDSFNNGLAGVPHCQ